MFCPKNLQLCGVIMIILLLPIMSEAAWSQIANIKHVFTNLDQGCLWCDTRQWEQASFTDRMSHASIAETWQPQTCHESGVLRKKITHILLFSFVFLPMKHNSCKENQLTMLIILHLFFFSSHVWSRKSQWNLISLWKWYYNLHACSLAVWSNCVVCMFGRL